MSTKFINGPAEGQTLVLERAPMFLRVVEAPRRCGLAQRKIDALDKLDDRAEKDEVISVYVKVSDDGGGFMDYTDKATGKRRGKQFTSATYRLFDRQPEDAEVRDNAKWQAWCQAAYDEMIANSEKDGGQ